MRRLQTAVPLGVCRSSGSLVRLPTRTTRLMFAMLLDLLVRTHVRLSVLGAGDGCGCRRNGLLARRARARAFDVAGRQVPEQHGVDLQHADVLVERLRTALEHDEVVHAFALLADLVGQPAPAPGVMAAPRAAAALDERAHARDQFLLLGLGLLGVEQQQNLIRRHGPDRLLPTVLVGSDCLCRSGLNGTLTEQEAAPL